MDNKALEKEIDRAQDALIDAAAEIETLENENLRLKEEIESLNEVIEDLKDKIQFFEREDQ